MKTQIEITGGISGNRSISNVLTGQLVERNSGNKVILYSTIAAAKKDLRNVFKKLNEDVNCADSGISRNNKRLWYDASEAKIEPMSDYMKSIFYKN